MAQTNNNEEDGKKDENIRNSKTYIRVLAFYNKHFPTDKKTYSIRLPLIGLVFSILSIHVIISLYGYPAYKTNILVILSYILLSAGTAYELYWGINVGDRKQYTPWIILKIIELILLFSHLIYGICAHRFFLEEVLGLIISGFIFLFINTYITYTVIAKSFQIFRGDNEIIVNRHADENIYDFPEELRSFENNV